MAAALMAAWMFPRGPSFEVVELVAMRGPQLARVHEGSAAELSIEMPDLADGFYRLDVVDASGGVLWSGRTSARYGRIREREPKALRAGVYWVRLYSDAGDLLREFGIESIR